MQSLQTNAAVMYLKESRIVGQYTEQFELLIRLEMCLVTWSLFQRKNAMQLSIQLVALKLSRNTSHDFTNEMLEIQLPLNLNRTYNPTLLAHFLGL